MSINEQWKNLEGSHDNDLSAMLTMPAIRNTPSRDPLVKLKKQLLINAIWGIVIGAGYIIVLAFFPLWQLFVCFGIVLLFTGWAVGEAMGLYRQIPPSLTGKSILEEMEFHYNAIQKWMKVQQKVWLFIYPVSALGGCMVGGMVGSGEPFNKIIQQPVMIISSLIAIAFSIPFGNYLTKQMFRKGFRQYTMQLEGNIRALKGENVG